MAHRREIVTVYAAGLLQGVALITFPAASAVFTSSRDYGLTSTEYGCMFLPQAIMAVIASLAGAGLRGRLGAKRIYLLGLFANLLSMILLVTSRFVMHNHSLAYGILLPATTFMGLGFGFTVPALNTFAAVFFPKNVDRAVLILNALLGLGTALAPVFVAIFVGLGIWWGLPVLVAALMLGLSLISVFETLHADGTPDAEDKQIGKRKFPARFWVFATFALFYGVCETANGNWAVPYMTTRFGASATIASLALTIFWSMVTAGRILFAASAQWLPEKVVCRALPFVLVAAFVGSACVPKTEPVLGILTFALAGLGCSALLPLTISFGQKELKTIAASAAGGLIAFYEIGYGIAAFCVGPLQSSAGLGLNVILGGFAVVPGAMAVLSFIVTQNAPAT
jgi:fucose permease